MLLKLINAKFPSKCPETGKNIYKGDATYYDVINKVAYHPSADIVRIVESQQEARQRQVKQEHYADLIVKGLFK